MLMHFHSYFYFHFLYIQVFIDLYIYNSFFNIFIFINLFVYAYLLFLCISFWGTLYLEIRRATGQCQMPQFSFSPAVRSYFPLSYLPTFLLSTFLLFHCPWYLSCQQNRYPRRTFLLAFSSFPRKVTDFFCFWGLP